MAENRQRQAGYAKGVPMGGVLDAAGAPANGGNAPCFLETAVKSCAFDYAGAGM